jgi:hypothetical protein
MNFYLDGPEDVKTVDNVIVSDLEVNLKDFEKRVEKDRQKSKTTSEEIFKSTNKESEQSIENFGSTFRIVVLEDDKLNFVFRLSLSLIVVNLITEVLINSLECSGVMENYIKSCYDFDYFIYCFIRILNYLTLYVENYYNRTMTELFGFEIYSNLGTKFQVALIALFYFLLEISSHAIWDLDTQVVPIYICYILIMSFMLYLNLVISSTLILNIIKMFKCGTNQYKYIVQEEIIVELHDYKDRISESIKIQTCLTRLKLLLSVNAHVSFTNCLAIGLCVLMNAKYVSIIMYSITSLVISFASLCKLNIIQNSIKRMSKGNNINYECDIRVFGLEVNDKILIIPFLLICYSIIVTSDHIK